jgi:uncharacterized protein YijF (DUF1287 family)
MHRRTLLKQLTACTVLSPLPLFAAPTSGDRLVSAARKQIGITTSYDPNYTRMAYPNGDVSRSTGVCADVIIRAARDAFGLDLQKLVHEDMLHNFAAYPANKTWGTTHTDASIDHGRVLNLETYWRRSGAQIWAASAPTPGDAFPHPAIGDIVTWRLDARLPHVGILATLSQRPTVIHNIGNGAEEILLAAFHPHRAAGLYRWPNA